MHVTHFHQYTTHDKGMPYICVLFYKNDYTHGSACEQYVHLFILDFAMLIELLFTNIMRFPIYNLYQKKWNW